MTQQKQIGWTSAIISLVILCLMMLWPEPWGLAELRVFGWVYGGMWLLGMFASIVAGRMLSSRWYYLTTFWLSIPVTLGVMVFLS
jgi:hypothetical protein